MHHVTSTGVRALRAQNVGHAQSEATLLQETSEELGEGSEHLASNGATVELVNKENIQGLMYMIMYMILFFLF